MASINGLVDISATSVKNSGQFYLGNNLDPGTAGQVIVSTGSQQPAEWGTNSATLPNALTMGTNLSLTSGNSSFDGAIADTIDSLPPNCFYNGSEYQLAFNQGIFMPNDDNVYYNIAVEDDSSTYIHGRVKAMTSSLELVGFITIPNGWRATKGLLSLVNSLGASITRTTRYQNVRTWGGMGYTTLGYGGTNTVTTLGTTMDGAVDRVLMLQVYTTNSPYIDFVGGGYITLEKI
tara:strand:- start:68 stop:769 length:702 start_codon:yes stop_codon:yes gene_type:complete